MSHPTPSPLLADRRLHVLLVGALVLRLVIGLDVFGADPTARALLSDSIYYRDWALALLGRGEFPFEGPALAYWMPPLYARLLAGLGASIGAMLMLQGLLGLATTVCIVALSEHLLGAEPRARAAALASGLLFTLFGPVIFFEGRLLGATLATFLAAVALLFLVRFEQKGRARELVAASLAMGLMSLARPNMLLVLPAMALWLAWRARGEAAPKRLWVSLLALGLPALLVLTPALVHNARATGALVPITTNGGVNFYFGNNPAAHGTFHAPGPEWGSIQDQRLVARQLAADATGAPVDDVAASRYWFARGLSFLTGEPLAALRLLGLKLADILSSTEFGIQYNLSAARTRAPSLWLVSLPFGVLLALSALGWRRTLAGPALFWLASGLVGALAYFTYSRFRLPLLPALLPFAGLGLVELLARAVRPRAVLIAVLLLATSLVPFEGSYPRHLESHAFGDMAAALGMEPGTRAERAELLDAALTLVPGNKPARVARGLLLLERGEARLALDELEAAAALPIEYPAADFELARLLAATTIADERDPERARLLIDAWLAAHPAAHPDAPSFRELARALAKD